MQNRKIQITERGRRQFIGNVFKGVFVSSLVAALPKDVLSASAHSKKTTGKEENDLKQLKECLANNGKPLIWVFTGDSITQGAKHTGGYRSYPEIFAERIRWEMNRTRDFVINTGISGNTTQDIISDFDWRIGQFQPGVVSLMIGTNDCSDNKDVSLNLFEDNLCSLINSIRKLNAVPILQTPSSIIKEKVPERGRLVEYVSVIQNLAQKKAVILIDNYAYWQNAIQLQGETAVFKKWLNDPVHPNGTGHSEIARLIFKEFSVFDPSASTCGGAHYEGDH